MEYPEFIARFYDVIYAKVRTGVDNEYFLSKTCDSKGKVLEVGVGTGRLFLDALNRGADVYGIDISPEMINVLHKKLDQKNQHRAWVEDGVEMQIDMTFELVIAPFRMFSHIIDVQDQLSFLNRVADHLKPEGQFIFDLYIPNLNILNEGFEDFKDFEEEYSPGKILKRYITTSTNLVKQVTDVSMKLCWDEKGKKRSETWTFPMRFFFRYEIEHLISLSKLQLVTIYGDHRENKLSKESTDFVVVCKKAG
jgi:SAM-dependent methyltransferase